MEELINWEDVPNDPIFTLTFPQRDMLGPEHFESIAALMRNGASRKGISDKANEIRLTLNPHPAGQMEHNVPIMEEERLAGMQHKYRETVLFFPSAGQTCHAYCTFCFRWPQFVGMGDFKFAMKEANELVEYLPHTSTCHGRPYHRRRSDDHEIEAFRGIHRHHPGR